LALVRKGVSFPNIGEKHGFTPVITSEQDIKTFNRGRIPRVPRKAVLVYDSDLEDALLARGGLTLTKRVHLVTGRVYLTRRKSTIVVRLAIGAPITALVVENLITMGAREFLIIGTAGGLKSPQPGELFLCTRALRDEGTSHHYYVPDSSFVEPDLGLNRALSKAMKEGGLDFKSAPSWTTDAPYTESVEELNKYSKDWIMTVEMEAAALFAVAKAKGVKAAAVFMISDVLSEKGWSGFVRGTKPEHFGTLVEVFRIFDRLGLPKE
jgi:uridine phosphorylase